jgi:hypothetical protein
MNRAAARALKYAILLLVLNIPLAVAWEVIFPGRIYDCTDTLGFGYLRPGHWVHDPIEFVDEVATGRSMSEPDTIRRGWSVNGLWAVWYTMISLSAIASWRLSRDPWKRSAAARKSRGRAMSAG